jgi:hypothetical protein
MVDDSVRHTESLGIHSHGPCYHGFSALRTQAKQGRTQKTWRTRAVPLNSYDKVTDHVIIT